MTKTKMTPTKNLGELATEKINEEVLPLVPLTFTGLNMIARIVNDLHAQEKADWKIAVSLLEDVEQSHRFEDDAHYNDCDKQPCCWCDQARKLISNYAELQHGEQGRSKPRRFVRNITSSGEQPRKEENG